MSGWRYLARRVLSGQWLHWDVPIARDELSWVLSGSGSLRGTIAPDWGGLRADDGGLLLQEWGTLVYAEVDGLIRWGGIVVRSAWSGASWTVEVAGLSAYLHGMPYLGFYSQILVDPLTVARHLWAHAQGFPDGSLGVVVDGQTSPVRVGKPGVAAYQEVQLDGVWQPKSQVPASAIIASAQAKLKANMDKNDEFLLLAAVGDFGGMPLPAVVRVGSEAIRVTGRVGTLLTGLQRGVDGTTATGHNAGTLVKFVGTPERTVAAVPAEPYQLAWWDAPDMGQEFTRLAAETPFDWAEECAWTGDGQTVTHRIRIGFPRLGTRRADLAFRQGDNVSSVVEAERDGDGYANEVLAVGAGEGSASLQRRVAVRDGRLRRPRVVTDKTITSGDRLGRVAQTVLAGSRDVLEIAQIDIVDHPNAPIGSWQLGDDILVQARLSWLGDVAVWSRIVGWSLIGEHRARLVLARSDSFIYSTN